MLSRRGRGHVDEGMEGGGGCVCLDETDVTESMVSSSTSVLKDHKPEGNCIKGDANTL